MSGRQSSKTGGDGTARKAPEPDIKSLLQQYLDSINALEQDDDQDDTDPGCAKAVVDSLDSEERLTLHYQGHSRTTTGVVRIMLEDGNVEAVALLDELRKTQEDAHKLLNQLRELHRYKTGSYPRPVKRRLSEV